MNPTDQMYLPVPETVESLRIKNDLLLGIINKRDREIATLVDTVRLLKSIVEEHNDETKS